MLKKAAVIVLLISCVICNSQTQLFTIKDGLCGNNITAITQTGNGYLWFGTTAGLNRYNGYSFQLLKLPESSEESITALLEDDSGRLWIGTTEGLWIFNQETQRFKRFFLKSQPQAYTFENLKVHCIRRFGVDSVLLSVGSGSLFCFVGDSAYNNYCTLNPVYEKNEITDFVVTPGKEIYAVIDKEYTAKLNPGSGEQMNTDKNLSLIYRLLKTKNGSVLALNSRGMVIDLKSPASPPLVKPFSNSIDHMTLCFLDNEEKIWLGYSDGSLLKLDIRRNTFQNHSRELDPFLTGAPRQLYIDRSGTVWLGTNYGLIRYENRRNAFENLLHEPSYTKVKDKKSIRGIVEDVDGRLFIGGYSGLFALDPATSLVRQYVVTLNGKTKRNAFFPYRLHLDKDWIWVTSEVKGLFKIHKKYRNIELVTPGGKHLPFTSAKALLPEGSDTLWIGTNKGLFLFEMAANRLTKFSGREKFNLANIEISDLVHGRNHELWIGSANNGIFCLDTGRSEIRQVFPGHAGLKNISTLFYEGDSVLWAGTVGNGLVRIKHNSEEPEFFNKTHGLADNSIAGILPDNSGALWISTFNGLSRFDPREKTFENFFEKHGLSSNEFNISATLKAGDGKIYLGGTNGINAFYSQQIKSNGSRQPKIYLTSYAKFDGTTNTLLEKEGDLTDLTAITLSPFDKFFSFSFSLDDYNNPLRNTFSYKLSGYDADYNFIGTQHTVRFNALVPGNYTLFIKGLNSEGLESENSLSINITVLQAFYTTWWFYGIIVIILAVIIYGFIRFKVNQKLKFHQLRTKLSSDLHDEVGSLLTRISIQAQLARQGVKEPLLSEEIDKIAETSRQATSAMSDVLWSIDARNDRFGNLIDRLREHAGDVLAPLEIEVLFTEKNIPEEYELNSSWRQHVFLIFKEAINNIARHSRATKVQIRFECRQDAFFLMIEDNGAASPSAGTKGGGQGLYNMKMRAEMLKGRLHIHQQNGFKIVLEVENFKFKNR